jgi:hypothetical protein
MRNGQMENNCTTLIHFLQFLHCGSLGIGPSSTHELWAGVDNSVPPSPVRQHLTVLLGE